MQNTLNYNLKKPDGNEKAKISDINDNMDVIDNKLKELEDVVEDNTEFTNLKQQVTTHLDDYGQFKTKVEDTLSEISDPENGVEAKVEAHANENLGHTYYGVATGTNNLSVSVPAYTGTLQAGFSFRFKNPNASTATMTVNVNSKGVKNVVDSKGRPFTKGVAGGVYTVCYDGLNFQLQGEGGGEFDDGTVNIPNERLAEYTLNTAYAAQGSTLSYTAPEVDASGNHYVWNTYGEIKKYSGSYLISTRNIGGVALFRIRGDKAVAITSSNVLTCYDLNFNPLWTYTFSGINNRDGLAIGPDGSVFVATRATNTGASQLTKITASGTLAWTYVGPVGQGANPLPLKDGNCLMFVPTVLRLIKVTATGVASQSIDVTSIEAGGFVGMVAHSDRTVTLGFNSGSLCTVAANFGSQSIVHTTGLINNSMISGSNLRVYQMESDRIYFSVGSQHNSGGLDIMNGYVGSFIRVASAVRLAWCYLFNTVYNILYIAQGVSWNPATNEVLITNLSYIAAYKRYTTLLPN